MIAAVADMRDLVHMHVTADLPIRARALPFADRVEIRFGKAFPVVLVVDRGALERLGEVIQHSRSELEAANRKQED
ncbi:MAG TPA: hypothetical protein VFV67_15405 [Actinophytocola sp.]|uniref:hypothetical protein n=1 Tax=Actinophytocola sp. TaxID=1872138 RepID=UPI002DB8B7CC|nr:hypothetical protein [Actinophytocola sp.]HEU5472038.1 hypothetical protein [Actinophytocola sp.]